MSVVRKVPPSRLSTARKRIPYLASLVAGNWPPSKETCSDPKRFRENIGLSSVFLFRLRPATFAVSSWNKMAPLTF
jgi:hypothetical protein